MHGHVDRVAARVHDSLVRVLVDDVVADGQQADGREPISHRIELATTLVERESTAAPR